MGLVAGSTTTNATLAATRVSADLAPGILQSATVICLDNGIGTGEIACLLTIEHGTADPAFTVATLCDDYVFTGHHPAWFGCLQIDAGDVLTLTYRSSVAARISFNTTIIRRED